MKIFVFLIFVFAASNAFSSECKNLKAEYEGAETELNFVVTFYKNCIMMSDMDDDCQEEFDDVGETQKKYTAIVAKIENSDCDF